MNKILLQEGYKPVAFTFIISIVLLLFISDFLGYLGIVITIVLLFIYRDSKRYIFKNTQSVLAPIDGTIIAIDEVKGKFKIYCKVGLLNNHILRAPIDGEVKVKKHQKGLNLNPDTYRATLYNEQIVLKFSDIKVKLISGLCNPKMKRIKECQVLQGDKISVFLDGLVIITIPKGSNIMVKIGEKLTSGQSILFKR